MIRDGAAHRTVSSGYSAIVLSRQAIQPIVQSRQAIQPIVLSRQAIQCKVNQACFMLHM